MGLGDLPCKLAGLGVWLQGFGFWSLGFLTATWVWAAGA